MTEGPPSKPRSAKPKRTSAKMGAPVHAPHVWTLEASFERDALGWKPQPAIATLKRAISEIRKVAKKDPVLGGEGAVILLERMSPAFEHVDSSSGATGAAVSTAIAELAPILASAPADAATRAAWLERLFAAHAADRMPFIASLADHWSELCASKEVASAWADRLLESTRQALSPERNADGEYHGIAACLSALHRAERFDELYEVLRVQAIWRYKHWGVRALVTQGRTAEAVAYAESCRSPWARDTMIDVACEEILLGAGMLDEAYAGYGVRATHAGTYLATFRIVTKKYPQKAPAEILDDLAGTIPGDEGKWFAAAKDAELYDEAIALATRSPADGKTLVRAARDHGETHPAFAVDAGFLALQWIAQGRTYDTTEADIQDAYRVMIAAAAHAGSVAETEERVRVLLDSERGPVRYVKAALGR